MFSLRYYFQRRFKQHFKPVVLVTGCSSGIGLALSHLLYECQEYRIILTARTLSLPKISEVFEENERVIVRPLDVTSAVSRKNLVEEVNQKWGGVNILINNAGISYRSVVEHMTDEDEFKQMSTNYLGPVALIREVLPRMREIGRGKIINVSSVSGMLAMPTMASYSASKYALEGASEALWYEMKPLGISVSLIQPGFINSNSFQKVYSTKSSSAALTEMGPYSDYYESMVPFVERLMKLSLVNPEKIARQILRVIKTENPPLWISATPDAWIFYYLRRFLPRQALHSMLFWLLPNSRKWAKGYTKRR